MQYSCLGKHHNYNRHSSDTVYGKSLDASDRQNCWKPSGFGTPAVATQRHTVNVSLTS